MRERLVEVDGHIAVGLQRDDPLVEEDPHDLLDQQGVAAAHGDRRLDELRGHVLDGREQHAREHLRLAGRQQPEVHPQVAVLRGVEEIVGLRQELRARGAQHRDGRAAHGGHQVAKHPDPVGAREVHVFEDQHHGRALGVDLEEPAEHRAGHELKRPGVFFEGLAQHRGAEAQAEKRPEKVQDLVDPPVAEEVHHLRADLVGLRVRVAALVQPEARAEDARDGRLDPAVRAGGAAKHPERGLTLGEVGDDLRDEP
jgi:hypothetical protein